jgi:hypothetical protein
LIDARGRVVASAQGDPESAPELASVRGACMAQGRILVATHEGVRAIEAQGAALVPGALFADTRPFVDATTQLLPAPHGALYAVAAQTITELAL